MPDMDDAFVEWLTTYATYLHPRGRRWIRDVLPRIRAIGQPQLYADACGIAERRLRRDQPQPVKAF